jgi:hypothetical protein
MCGMWVGQKPGMKILPSGIGSGLVTLLALDFNEDNLLCHFAGCTMVGGSERETFL